LPCWTKDRWRQGRPGPDSAKGGSGRCGRQASRLKASDNDLELEGLNGRATSRLIMEEIVDGSAFAALRDYLSHKPKS